MTKLGYFLLGVLTGAGLMYLLDPDGRRERQGDALPRPVGRGVPMM